MSFTNVSQVFLLPKVETFFWLLANFIFQETVIHKLIKVQSLMHMFAILSVDSAQNTFNLSRIPRCDTITRIPWCDTISRKPYKMSRRTTLIKNSWHNCCVFRPAHACLRMRSHGRKWSKTSKSKIPWLVTYRYRLPRILLLHILNYGACLFTKLKCKCN